MANTATHALVGAAAACAPDAALYLFGWRRDLWLPETHPLVRLHRWLHGPRALLVLIALAYASHIVIDRLSRHRSPPCTVA